MNLIIKEKDHLDLRWTGESYTSPQPCGVVGIATALQPKIDMDISFLPAGVLKQNRMKNDYHEGVTCLADGASTDDRVDERNMVGESAGHEQQTHIWRRGVGDCFPKRDGPNSAQGSNSRPEGRLYGVWDWQADDS